MIKAVIFDCTGVLTDSGGDVNRKLLEYVRRLKPHYKIGMLSNLSAQYVERLFTPADRLLFDRISLASETGVAKPDPRAYRLVANQLEVDLEQCIFVDDDEGRCEAAREQGMQTVVYSSLEQATGELEAIIRQS